jgi:hypothetical protein
MPRYRVTLTRRSTEIVDAPNPYQAAILATQGSDGVEVESVTAAVGRPPAPSPARKGVKKAAKKVAKKRRPLSPEARAKLAQNLIKARAARAAKAKAAKKSVAKRSTRKAARKTTKKR